MRERIALSGWMGSGKTFAAHRLCELFGYKVVSHTDPLKMIVEAVRSNDRRWLASIIDELASDKVQATLLICLTNNLSTHHSIEIQSHQKPRSFMCSLGSEFCKLDPEIFVRYLRGRVDAGLVVVDDVRLPLEYASAVDLGFTTVRCVCHPTERLRRLGSLYPGFDIELMGGYLEHALDLVLMDYQLDTGCDLANFDNQLAEIVGV